ncbi:ribonuclease R [Bacilli bacterium PM5-9]|nr:ribonuclease R [Bacilli bacterium PM5-9]
MIKDKILTFLDERKHEVFTYQEIAQYLMSIDNEIDLNEIYKTLVLLENDYEIVRSKKDKVQSAKNFGLLFGVLEIKKKGFGFVRTKDFDVFVSKDKLNGAINKDKVFVKLDKNSDGINKEGSIYRVIEHGYDLIVGNVVLKKGKTYVIPDDKSLDFWIKINAKNTMNASEGHKVLCYISEIDKKSNTVFGKIKTIIGHINDVGIDILAIVYKYGFNPEFSKGALKEAKSYHEEDIVVENRHDLRDKLTITIDGADAKDLDDAIGLEINEHGNRVLYVSIADVSYYVKEKSELDKEAYARSTSVYLVDRVVPMLPHQLSNGICSLLPEVDRLTQTCKMEFDKNGKVINYEIFESIINSNYRMTYDDVNSILDGDERLQKKYHEINELLFEMKELSLLLRKNKEKRGMLEFDIPEPKIIVDGKGKVMDIIIRDRGEGEKIIEDFMIIANETVAAHIYWQDLPFIYRVHDKPNPDKINAFLAYASAFDIKMKKKEDNLNSKDIQKLLKEIENKNDSMFLDKLLLRSMAKAVYQKDCIGHFGLASKYYTHFTSPIRRYPDLIVHRLLRKYLYNKEGLNTKELGYLDEKLDKIGDQTSRKERDAIEAEREVNDMKMAEYMKNHVGESYIGYISSITSFGFFVELPNTIEGLVHISTLNDDHYAYDSEFHLLKGERTNKMYRLGSEVEVIVDKVSVKERNIDFILKNSNGRK